VVRPVSDLHEIARTIAVASAKYPRRVVLVAVDGLAGAGKSMLAGRIARQVPHAEVIHTDDFAFGWSMSDEEKWIEAEHPLERCDFVVNGTSDSA
jgi:hypothetical protein